MFLMIVAHEMQQQLARPPKLFLICSKIAMQKVEEAVSVPKRHALM
jgi:hypothetical protein